MHHNNGNNYTSRQAGRQAGRQADILSQKRSFSKIPARNLKPFRERSFTFIAPSVWNPPPALSNYLYLHAYQVRVTAGDLGLYCCTCVTYFESQLTSVCVNTRQFLLQLTPAIASEKKG